MHASLWLWIIIVLVVLLVGVIMVKNNRVLDEVSSKVIIEKVYTSYCRVIKGRVLDDVTSPTSYIARTVILSVSDMGFESPEAERSFLALREKQRQEFFLLLFNGWTDGELEALDSLLNIIPGSDMVVLSAQIPLACEIDSYTREILLHEVSRYFSELKE